MNIVFKTRERYKELLARINAAIGNIGLEKLQAHHLKAFYKNLAEAGINSRGNYAVSDNLNAILQKRKLSRAVLANKAGMAVVTVSAAARGVHIGVQKATAICKALNLLIDKVFTVHKSNTGLADKTILHHHRLISAILEKAKRARIIPFNVAAEHATAPKVAHKEARYLTDDEARKFLSLLLNEKDIRIKTALVLLLFTGVRRGELCGLSWPDIDRKSNYKHCAGITISKRERCCPDKERFKRTGN